MALNHWFFTLFPSMRQTISRGWYKYLSKLDKGDRMVFMNHGYVSLDPDAEVLELLDEDEENRYSIQLYHHVAEAIDWTGLDALEVGSGRGGGAAYIKRRFEPRSMTGVDITPNAVDFCNQYHATENLSFVCCDAQDLQFDDDSFDVVINVESSLHYPNVERFLGEVVRVLRPNGYFLHTDIRYYEDVDTWRTRLQDTGLQLVKEEDITPNVVRALELDSARKRRLIERHAPRIIRGSFKTFAGLTGAELARGAPGPGERLYLNFVLRKR
jgi:ubiquinone/menaquinone biosynthesis C-methylase UbiE